MERQPYRGAITFRATGPSNHSDVSPGSIKVKSLYNLSTYLGELEELEEIIYKLLYANCLQAVNDV